MGRQRDDFTKTAAQRVRDSRAKRRNAEQDKRARVRAELERAMREPLTPGLRLSKREREKIAERVSSGAIRQSLWPKSGAVGTKAVPL